MVQREVTVGRANSCDIWYEPNCVHVSNEHAIIYSDGKQLFLRDTSTNGTLINNMKIHRHAIAINYGDSILLAGKYPLSWERISVFFPDSIVMDRGTVLNEEPVPVVDVVCDSLYETTNGLQEEQKEKRKNAFITMGWAGVMLLLGIVATGMSDTKVYVGAMALGVIYMIIGFFRLVRSFF